MGKKADSRKRAVNTSAIGKQKPTPPSLERSRMMAAVKSSGTGIETKLGRALWAVGCRYRKNQGDLPGKPDFVFPSKRCVIFCDGDFWHGSKSPKNTRVKNNLEFWENKISANRKRDAGNNRALVAKGWTVIRFWGSEIEKRLNDCVALVNEVLESGAGPRVIRLSALDRGIADDLSDTHHNGKPAQQSVKYSKSSISKLGKQDYGEATTLGEKTTIYDTKTKPSASTPTTINQGFRFIAAPDAAVLILGSGPSVASLETREYYAHPRNAFWPIILSFCDPSGDLYQPYLRKTQLLLERRVALWDCLAAFSRVGSLDSAIKAESAEINDFKALTDLCPNIQAVLLNGGKAAELYRKKVVKAFPRMRDIPAIQLPSTSPAYAAMTLDKKKQLWHEQLNRFLNESNLTPSPPIDDEPSSGSQG